MHLNMRLKCYLENINNLICRFRLTYKRYEFYKSFLFILTVLAGKTEMLILPMAYIFI